MKTPLAILSSIVVGIGIGTASFAIYQHYQGNPSESPEPSTSPTATLSPTPTASPAVTLSAPSSTIILTSPLTIKGTAPNSWFFEGQLPVQLTDANGKVISQGNATAQTDWTEEGPVDFKATLTFTRPSTSTGSIGIKKDNPSGLASNDASATFPVKFK